MAFIQLQQIIQTKLFCIYSKSNISSICNDSNYLFQKISDAKQMAFFEFS